jgi:hypothetical protein
MRAARSAKLEMEIAARSKIQPARDAGKMACGARLFDDHPDAGGASRYQRAEFLERSLVAALETG